MKTGIELEYWVTNDSGKLTSAKRLSQLFEDAEQEFVEPMLELKTSPHEEVRDLEQEARSKLREAIEQSEEMNLRIVPTGTTLAGETPEMLESKRGELQQRIVGEKLEYAKNVAGTHFHFEQGDVEKQLNTLTALDPALAAMNSSPYFSGRNLGSSSRNIIYRYRCYEDLPRHGQLWDYTENVEEWRRRIQTAFREFKQEASKKGIAEEKVDEHFNAEDALWTPVRLRDSFSTVEWRAPDTGLLSDAIKLLRDVKTALKKEQQLPGFEKVQQKSRKAMETGKVDSYLREFGIRAPDYSPLSDRLFSGSIGEKEARKKRLKAAKLLREDVGL
ncbi:MAG: glutamate-cysteine ligase family protein [Candidatus Nanohaloarchaea archaeon]